MSEERAARQKWTRGFVPLTITGGATSFWNFWLFAHSYTALPDLWMLNHKLFAGIAFLVIAVIAPYINLSRKAGSIACIIPTFLGVAVSVAGLFVSSSAMAISVWCVSGCCLSWFSYRYYKELISRTTIEAFASICLSTAGFTFCYLLSALFDWNDAVVAVLLPLATGGSLLACTALSTDAPIQSFSPHFGKGIREIALGPCLCLCGLCFVYASANIMLKVNHGSFAYGPVPSITVSIVGSILCACVSLFLYWNVALRKRHVEFFSLVKVPIVLLTSALIIAGIGGENPLLQIATFCSVWILSICYSALTVDIAQHSQHHPGRVVAVIGAVYSLSYCLGRCLFYVVSGAAATGSAMFDERLCFILLGVTIAVVIVSFRPQDRVSTLLFYDINNNPEATRRAEETVDKFQSACDLIGQRYSLSQREQEVMSCIAKGYSKPFIAEMLNISDNTVRTYSKRIYEKLGIHSRRELQEMIGL